MLNLKSNSLQQPAYYLTKWFSAGLWIILCCYYGSSHASTSATKDNSSFYLEVVLNGKSTSQIIYFQRLNDQWYVEQSSLENLGVHIGQSEKKLLAVADISQSPAIYDQENQRIFLDILTHYLPHHSYQSPKNHADLQQAQSANPISHGIYVNYLAVADSKEFESPSYHLFHQANGFSQYFNWESTGQFDRSEIDNRYIRFDSRIYIENTTKLNLITLGDILSAAPYWASSLRMGGLRISRDYTINPNLVTYPLPAFFGSSHIPTQADVFINGQLAEQYQLQPGSYDILLPAVNAGKSTASIVTKDSLGRDIVQNISFYVTNRLLAKGFIDYDISLGTERKYFGVHSNEYADEALFSSHFRWGANDQLTPELFIQKSTNYQNIGIGFTHSLASLGVFEIAYAESKKNLLQGYLYSAAYEYYAYPINLFSRFQFKSNNYREFTTHFFDEGERQDMQLGAGVNTALGTFNSSYLYRSFSKLPTQKSMVTSWSTQFSNGISLFFNYQQELNNRHSKIFSLNLSIPFGQNGSAGISTYRHAKGKVSSHAYANQAAPITGGVGYGVAFSDNGEGSIYSHVTHHSAEARLRYNRYQYQQQTSAELQGSLGYAFGHLFSSRTITDAFAIVDTNGFDDVPIYHGYTLQGHSNHKGKFLLANLLSHQENRVAINPLDLSGNITLSEEQLFITPARRGAVLVNFNLAHVLQLTLTLKDHNKNLLPPGTTFYPQDKSSTYRVGFDGELYLTFTNEQFFYLKSSMANCELVINIKEKTVSTDSNHCSANAAWGD